MKVNANGSKWSKNQLADHGDFENLCICRPRFNNQGDFYTAYIHNGKGQYDINPWRQVPIIDKINKVMNAKHDNPHISSPLLLMSSEFINLGNRWLIKLVERTTVAANISMSYCQFLFLQQKIHKYKICDLCGHGENTRETKRIIKNHAIAKEKEMRQLIPISTYYDRKHI